MPVILRLSGVSRSFREFIFLENAQQLLTAHLFGISPDATQHAQQFRALAVFHRGDILEIIGTVIAPVTVSNYKRRM